MEATIAAIAKRAQIHAGHEHRAKEPPFDYRQQSAYKYPELIS